MTNNSLSGCGDHTSSNLLTAELLGADVQLAIFLVVGVFGNSLIISVFWEKVRKMWRRSDRHVYNHMILVLAMADLVTLLVFVPYEWANINGFVQTTAACKALQYMTSSLQMFVHMVLSIAIPVERFFAVCKPHSTFGKKQVFGIIGGVALAALLSGIGYPVLSNVEKDKMSGRCICTSSYNEHSFEMGAAYLAIGMIGIIAIVVLYSLILVRIFKTYKRMKEYADKKSVGQFKAMTKVVAMLFGVTLVYLMCWLPYFLIKIDAIPRDYRYKFFFLFNNATNFIVYGFVNATVRKAMVTKLRCKKLERPSEFSMTHSNTEKTVVEPLNSTLPDKVVPDKT